MPYLTEKSFSHNYRKAPPCLFGRGVLYGGYPAMASIRRPSSVFRKVISAVRTEP